MKYSIQNENTISGHVFSIDEKTGVLTMSTPANSMDTERGVYEIEVTATDSGFPPLKNTTTVRIRVGVSSNQKPVFRGNFSPASLKLPGPPVYRVSLPENAKFGTNVTHVQAIDPDGLNSEIIYKIRGSIDDFVIDEK